MNERDLLAAAGIDKTVLKTWQDVPYLMEGEEADGESKLEGEIRQRFADLRLWQRLAEADRRSLVGGYSGLILRFADSRRFNEPVDRVRGGLDGLAEVIPAWAGQLTVSDWDTDETSEAYGQPRMFAFNEAAVPGQAQQRSFQLHPDRVVIWSSDGTVHARSALKSGYNDLLTMEKVSGAGGEGFWKKIKYYPTTTREESARMGRITDLMRSGQAFVDLGVEPLNAETDRAMICGNLAFNLELKEMLEEYGLEEGANSKPAQYVVEKAFLD